MQIGYHNLNVGCLYRPPDERVQFWTTLEEVLEPLEGSDIVLLGDLNVDTLDKTQRHPQFSYLNRLNSSLQTKDIVCSPTRCTATSSKCLDVILTNVHFFKKGAVMEDLDISDHALVHCCGHFPGRGGKYFKYAQASRNWQQMNVAVFEQALDTQLQGLDTTEVNSMWTEWRNKFLAALDEAVPKKIIKNNRKRKKHCPWMSPELLHLLHQQKSLHRRIKKTHHQQQDLILRHRKLRNRTNNLYRQLKNVYFQNQLHAYRRDPKTFWSTLNYITGRQKANHPPPTMQLSSLAEHFKSLLYQPGLTNALPFGPDKEDALCMLHPQQEFQFTIS